MLELRSKPTPRRVQVTRKIKTTRLKTWSVLEYALTEQIRDSTQAGQPLWTAGLCRQGGLRMGSDDGLRPTAGHATDRGGEAKPSPGAQKGTG